MREMHWVDDHTITDAADLSHCCEAPVDTFGYVVRLLVSVLHKHFAHLVHGMIAQ
jgi:hypothetical protein